jgi:hypothetical protein
VRREELFELFIGRRVGQAAHVDFVRHVLLPGKLLRPLAGSNFGFRNSNFAIPPDPLSEGFNIEV